MNRLQTAVRGIAVLTVMMVGAAPAADVVWTTKAPMPTPRYGAMCGEVDGQVYVIGGYNHPSQGGPALTTVERYDPQLDNWTTRSPMLYGLALGGAGVVGGKVCVAGGVHSWGGVWQSTVEEYDPATDRWAYKASMPTPRYGVRCAAVNGKLYAIGGYSNYRFVSTVEEYDPATNTWRARAGMPTPRFMVGCAVLDGRIYVVGGANSTGWLASTEVYDPVTDNWTTVSPMPTRRYGLVCCESRGRLYAVGGYNGVALTTVEVYDPAIDRWAAETNLPTARYGLVGSELDGTIYAIGGLRGTYQYLTTNEAGRTARPPVPATVDFDPDRLNLRSRGQWVTCYVELPEGHQVSDIETASVRIARINSDGLEPPLFSEGPVALGDYDEDGIPDLMVKFGRAELIQVLRKLGIGHGDEPELTLAGELATGDSLTGSDRITVIDNGEKRAQAEAGDGGKGLALTVLPGRGCHRFRVRGAGPDPVLVRLFSPSGAAVCVLRGAGTAGQAELVWEHSAGSGVFFYEVEAAGRFLRGKLTVAR